MAGRGSTLIHVAPVNQEESDPEVSSMTEMLEELSSLLRTVRFMATLICKVPVGRACLS